MKMIDKIMRSMRDTGLLDGMSDEDCDTLATAALEGMREPTMEMIEIGMDYDERELNLKFRRPPTCEECQIGEWQAMIDAALNE